MISFTYLVQRWSLTLLSCWLSALTVHGAVTVDPGCAQWNGDVNSALAEAVSIANYAANVWQSRATRPGTLLQDMLGASNEDDQTTLSFAQSKSAWLEFNAEISSKMT